MSQNSRTAFTILGLLSLAPMSGYDLKTTIAQSTGNFWSESYGQLYPQLKKLEAGGLIKGRDNERGQRKRRVYSITMAGRAALSDWLAEPPKETPPRNELLLKLFFAGRGSARHTYTMLHEARDRRIADIAGYEAKAKELKARYRNHPDLDYWLATLRHGILQGRSFIEWCDETLAGLDASKQKDKAP